MSRKIITLRQYRELSVYLHELQKEPESGLTEEELQFFKAILFSVTDVMREKENINAMLKSNKVS